MLCIYNTGKYSEAIRHALIDFLLLPTREQIIDRYSLYHISTRSERLDTRKISVRLPKELYQLLKKGESLQDTVIMILARIAFCPLKEDDFAPGDKKLLQILGSKWDSRMQDAIRQIFDSCGLTWERSVETCASALAIHANFRVADKVKYRQHLLV